MTSIRIQVDGDGIRELLDDPGVADDLERRAQAVAAAVTRRGIMVDGEPGEVSLPVRVEPRTGLRASYAVILDHPAGLAVESKHRVLVGSLDAAR